MNKRGCGHYVFDDDQHKVCIAKHLNIKSIYANVVNLKTEDKVNCSRCSDKIEQEIETKKFKKRLFTLLNLKRDGHEIPPPGFIDEEYMDFKEKCSFV
ncbi:hypothetical protein [Priestia megaterium]|uniref:hypothetical protein n=1 Tax=Priestia megaterium TaxID=1404 RepID=UPI001C52C284|nr:hypothetical protein [Priestia megaterium]MBW0933529.1 hypothetical protein [Priestia megaterium]